MKTNYKINPSVYEINLLRQVGELYYQLAGMKKGKLEESDYESISNFKSLYQN